MLLKRFDETFGQVPEGSTRGEHNGDYRRLLERGELRRNRWQIIVPAVTYTVASLLHLRWMPAVGALIGVGGIVVFVRARRSVAGLCAHCGYDLRATPPGKPCPECGHAATPSEVTP